MSWPARILQCPNCLHRFDADSDATWFLLGGFLLGMLLGLAVKA